jgi:hypothetical protein
LVPWPAIPAQAPEPRAPERPGPPSVRFRPLAHCRPPVPESATAARLAAASATEIPPAPTPPPGRAELRRLLGALLEILDGQRPARQLDDLLPLHRQQPLLRLVSRRPGGVRRSLRSVHPARISERVVELCATVEQGQRIRALAARLERADNRWRFTSIALL